MTHVKISKPLNVRPETRIVGPMTGAVMAEWAREMRFVGSVCENRDPHQHSNDTSRRQGDLHANLRGRYLSSIIWGYNYFELLIGESLLNEAHARGFTGLNPRPTVLNWSRLRPALQAEEVPYFEVDGEEWDVLDRERSGIHVDYQCPVCGWEYSRKVSGGMFFRESVPRDVFRVPEYPFHLFVSERFVKLLDEVGAKPYQVTRPEDLPLI